MMEPCGLLHLAATVGARGNVDLEHSGEEAGPRDTVLSAGVVGVLVVVVVVVGLGQSDEVDAWRRHEGGELLDQLGGAEQERASAVPGSFQ